MSVSSEGEFGTEILCRPHETDNLADFIAHNEIITSGGTISDLNTKEASQVDGKIAG